MITKEEQGAIIVSFKKLVHDLLMEYPSLFERKIIPLDIESLDQQFPFVTEEGETTSALMLLLVEWRRGKSVINLEVYTNSIVEWSWSDNVSFGVEGVNFEGGEWKLGEATPVEFTKRLQQFLSSPGIKS